jgi:hypothetical protein
MRARSLVGDVEKAHAWEWAPSREVRRKDVIAGAPQHVALGVAAVPSRVDYDLWCFKRGMDWGIDYWYFDELQNEGQINPVTELGYRDEDGRWLPTGRLFTYRELWKRLYTMMQLDHGQKEPIIVMHNTSTTYAGPMAFCTTTWDFEEANADPAQRQLTKFGLDYLITESMGHQYGFVGSTLGPALKFEPWLAEHPEEKESAERHWMGVHMILDMNPYLTRAKAVCDGLAMLGDFGWNQPDCRWIPYWEAEAKKLYGVTPGENVYVSAYQRPGRMLLILLNDTNSETAVTWRPSGNLKVQRVRDAEAPEEEVPARDGAYTVKIPHFDYRALVAELAE